jgi:hypothetical protein
MSNSWIQHVKEYAKKNNVSYGCALSQPDIKDGYIPVKKISKKQMLEDRNKTSILNSFVKRVKEMTDEDKPIVLMKYNNLSSDLKELFKNKYPNLNKKIKT